MFRYFAHHHRGTQEHQIWQPDNHPIELYSEEVTIQNLQYIHANPVRSNLVRRPEEWVYSSASNYAEAHGVYDVKLLWTGFDEDGWFFGNVDFLRVD